MSAKMVSGKIKVLRNHALETAARLQAIDDAIGRLSAGQTPDSLLLAQLVADVFGELSALEFEISATKQTLAHSPDSTKSATPATESR